MAGAVVKLLGVARLSARLDRIRDETDDRLVDAVNEASGVVTGTAKQIVAVDTGTLRASIHPIPAEVSGGHVTGGAATSEEYAPYVEFGTGVRGNGSYPYSPDGIDLAYSDDHPGQVAQPFLYPALQQNKAAIRKLIKGSVKEGL